MSEFIAAFSALKYVPHFWNVLLFPFVPIGIFVFFQWYLVRKGASPTGSRWARVALVVCCSFTPALFLTAYATDIAGQVEVLTELSDAFKVTHAYDALCKFSPDQQTPENKDYATNVLRDHVLWATRDNVGERKPLAATETIPCDHIPSADNSASRDRFEKLMTMKIFFMACFEITALVSVWGSVILLLPRRERRDSNGRGGVDAVATEEAAGTA